MAGKDLDIGDAISTIIRVVLKAVGAEHKTKLLCGIVVGTVIGLFVGAMPMEEKSHWIWVASQNVPTAFGPRAGAGVALLIAALMKLQVTEQERATIHLFEDMMEKAGLSRTQKHMNWNAIIAKYIENAGPETGQREIA